MVPLTLFTMAVPLPFGALGLTEQVSSSSSGWSTHPGGALAMMGFRVLMYGCGADRRLRLPRQPPPGPRA